MVNGEIGQSLPFTYLPKKASSKEEKSKGAKLIL